MTAAHLPTRRGALLACALAAWACASVDVALTRAAFAYRPAGLALTWQTVVGWLCLAALVAVPAVWLGRRLRAPVVSALALVAAPVLAHQVVRGPMRTGDWTAPGTLLAGAGVVLGLALLLIAGGAVERRAARGGSPAALAARLAVALLLLGPVALVWPRGAAGERAVLPERHGAPEGRPNLLLLVWDTTRADHLSPYGYDAALTPHLARLAERGAVYESAWSASLFTLSSHTSLLTGLPPTLHGTTLRHQQVTAPALPSLLEKAGYRTGAFVGTSVLAGGRGLEEGFDVYDDLVDPPVCDTHLWGLVKDVQSLLAKHVPALRGNGLPHWFNDFQRPAGEVLDRALRFINADDRRPWFVMVNLFDVHWPYSPGAHARDRWVDPYGGPLDGYLFRSDDYVPGYEPDESDKAFIRDLYDAEMWELDAAVDRFLRSADVERGDVCVVVTADHGEGLGEAGLWSHDEFVAPQTHVPLIVYAPGRVTPGVRVRGHVSGTDVAPTLLALAGIPLPPDLAMAGAPLVGDELPDDRIVFIQDYDNPSPARDGDAVLRGRFKLVSRGGERTLHDVHADPLDQVDIAAQHPEVAAELGAALDALLAARTDGAGGLENVDTLRALGYLGGDDGKP